MNTAIQQSEVVPSNYFYDPQLGVYITIRTIDPVMAKELLMGQRLNRNLSSVTVSRYKKFMEQGQWTLNGEPIIFGGNKLIDGQHRLSACIKSNTTFQAVWIELRDDGAFKTLNQGKRRSGADVLSIAGHKSVTVLNAALSLIAKIDETNQLPWQGFGGGTRIEIPNHEIEAWSKKYPGIDVSIRKVHTWYKNFRLKKGPLSVLHYMLRRSEKHLFDFADESADSNADKFMECLCNGLNLAEGNPVLPFRNYLLRLMALNEKISPHYIIRGGVLSYNAWLKGQKTNVCRVGKIPTIPKIVKVNGGT